MVLPFRTIPSTQACAPVNFRPPIEPNVASATVSDVEFHRFFPKNELEPKSTSIVQPDGDPWQRAFPEVLRLSARARPFAGALQHKPPDESALTLATSQLSRHRHGRNGHFADPEPCSDRAERKSRFLIEFPFHVLTSALGPSRKKADGSVGAGEVPPGRREVGSLAGKAAETERRQSLMEGRGAGNIARGSVN